MTTGLISLKLFTDDLYNFVDPGNDAQYIGHNLATCGADLLDIMLI